MKRFLRRLLKLFAYLAAATVILLAIAVGLFRLFLPRVPEYQDEIKAWASAAIGVQVEFSGMDARWGLSGPELEFYNAELVRQDSGVRIVAAEQVRIGVGLMRLMFEQSLVVDRLVIRDTSVDIRQQEDGSYRIQGLPLTELFQSNAATPEEIEVIGEDVELRFMQPGDERPRFFSIPRVRVSIDENRIAADAGVQLPDDLGSDLTVSATQVLTGTGGARGWNVIVEGDDIKLAGWSALSASQYQFQSGLGDIDLAVAITDGRVSNATSLVDFIGVSLDNKAFLDLRGRVEVDIAASDWLVAAHELEVSFAEHDWPQTSLRVESSVDQDGSIVMLDTAASYLRLDDLAVVLPWLPDEQQQQLRSLGLTGEVQDLVATVSDISASEPQFNVSAEFIRAGVASTSKWPGIRGFSGLVRANRAGGRLEIDASELQVVAPDYLPQVIDLTRANGTVIWRNSSNRTIILSDSIAISNEFFDSQSNVELVLNKEGGSPEIDLASNWSISDIAAAKRYIPERGLNPKLYDWFQMALVSGAITRGTTSLQGPLQDFPFDDGEGRLLIEASVRNLEFQYHKDWPATEESDMEVVLDNARLYTRENRSVSAGIPVVNAQVDIPDLREPILHMESFSAGTLAAIREFCIASPIADVFGGQLDRVSVDGDASLALDLLVPLKKDRIKDFEFTAKIRSNNGSLSIAGFTPPVTDLIGEVTITRDEVSSESLGGRFLGENVSISLARSDDPQFSVIASATGRATADGLVNELGVPLEGLIGGTAPYETRILFPSKKAATPVGLTIQIDSNLQGLELDLPEPLNKAADEALRIYGNIRFVPGGEAIETSGGAENRLAWRMAFTRPEGVWDFDRGVAVLGGGELVPAETRGLHIRGRTGVVRVEDWLNLSRSGEKNLGAADRIRSIDLLIDDLYLLGQHLEGHHVRVDRSALDWLVQFDGEDVVGSVFVPYEIGGDRAMTLEMQKLRLPGDDARDAEVATLDPRSLPPIELTANEFAFGDRYVGRVQATLVKTSLGLEAQSLTASDATFSIDGSGRWIADSQDPLGSHSYVSATLTSRDVQATMARLNYEPGIDSEEMRIQFDLDWSGSPRADIFAVLDGEVEVRLGDGQLEEVEPGAGRMFGLMSIVALPRRLSLDFRDVFSRGFGFDEISGTFTIAGGKTYTCDLSLKGPAADIGIVGVADLPSQRYDQTAIVSANVGNTLPIVGAVVAGPQVAAALLIFSQIFKKPLQEVGQVYYGIRGPWDNPTVESTDSAAFVESGELAGCLQDVE